MPSSWLPRRLDSAKFKALSAFKKRTFDVPASPIVETTAEIFPPVPLFNRLPVELQVEIFTHCLPEFPHFNINEAPLLVARVCSAWRTLVLSTPKLWSSFEIEVIGSGSSISLHDLKIMSTMELWLQRSRNYPLSVRVVHIPMGRIPDPRSAQLLALLIPEARRWRQVQFIIPTANIAPLRESFPADFPVLRSLTLQMKGLWDSEPSVDISAIPWHQLTTLNLHLEPNHLPSLDDCLTILAQADRLKQCSMSVDCILDTETQHSNLVLSSLEEFHLILHGGDRTSLMTTGGPSSRFIQFLGLLLTPNLHTLDLTWFVYEPRSWESAHADFRTFLHTVSSTLRTLSISYLPLSADELKACLVQVPNITELNLRFSLSDIEHDPITDDVVSALAFGPETTDSESVRSHQSQDSHADGPLLPCLLSLDVQCNGMRLSNSVLLSMIQSRWDKDADPSGDGFKRFRLLSMKPVLGEVRKRLDTWASEGLEISIDSLLLR